jgi:predicted nucleic acid-binding protein
VDGVLDAFAVLPFGLAEARVHARLWAALAAKGKMMGAHDLQVAATCLAHGADVVTLNTAAFKRVPGLRLADIKRFGRR